MKMSNQEIFDRVATHLFTQGMQSIETRGCLYRGPNGTKCAVGCLIADEDYDPEMDSPHRETHVMALKTSGFLPPYLQSANLTLLRELQDSHDGSANWASRDALRQRLENVVKFFNLDDSCIRNQTGAW